MSQCLTLTPACIYAGDSYFSKILITDSAGDDATATAATYKWLRRGASSADISFDQADSEVDISTAGEVSFSLATADTGALTAGTYDVEAVITTSGGVRTAVQVVRVKARQ